jgi:hypothetical protein
MPTVPESAKTSLAQKLTAQAWTAWPSDGTGSPTRLPGPTGSDPNTEVTGLSVLPSGEAWAAGARGVSRPRWRQSRSPVALPGPLRWLCGPAGRRPAGGRRWRC